MLKDTLIFTVVDVVDDKDPPISIEDRNPDYVKLTVKDKTIHIQRQQLMELGALFLSLAGQDVDFDSAYELLDGYGIPDKNLIKAIKSLLDVSP